MTLLSVVSFLVPVFSFASKGGIAHQVVKNYRRKATDGLSVPFFAIGTASYATFTLYGVLIRSLPVALAQFPGVILAVIVLGQVLLYRGKKAGATATAPPGEREPAGHHPSVPGEYASPPA